MQYLWKKLKDSCFILAMKGGIAPESLCKLQREETQRADDARWQQRLPCNLLISCYKRQDILQTLCHLSSPSPFWLQQAGGDNRKGGGRERECKRAAFKFIIPGRRRSSPKRKHKPVSCKGSCQPPPLPLGAGIPSPNLPGYRISLSPPPPYISFPLVNP